MNILITGGCGFIGVNLIAALLRGRYARISALDSLQTGSLRLLEEAVQELGGEVVEGDRGLDISPGRVMVNVHVGDVRDADACLHVTRRKDVVVHLAASTSVVDSVIDPIRDFDVNVGGTLNMLKACVDNGVQLFVFASSGAPLGGQAPATEETPLLPASPYGASKSAGEAYCAAFFKSYGLGTVALRFSNVFGPYCSHKQSAVATFFWRALRREPFVVYGDGSQTRDFLHIKDLCQAISKLFDLYDEGRLDCLVGRVVQIASGRETRIIDVIHEIKRLVEPDLGAQLGIVYKPARAGEIHRSVFSISRARQLLGYEPSVSLREGLEEVWRWMKIRQAASA